MLIGTQAIVYGEAQFKQLGLVVIDEQHRFGVRQRATLKQAGADPHYLVMTATPIPRTVAMTLYGDLDVSTITESPPGRQPLHTYLAEGENRAKWWDFFRRHLREGRQGYVIVPLVEESEHVDTANLQATFEELAHGELEAFRLGLVHGRMTAEEKDAALSEFAAGRTQVLVATSVVEVGIDVPNATLMTILGADRFGLAQLHQMRGRVCRGKFPGYCCVFADEPTDEAQERLKAFVSTTDGFQTGRNRFPTPRPRRFARHPATRPAAVSSGRSGSRHGNCERSPRGCATTDSIRPRPVASGARRLATISAFAVWQGARSRRRGMNGQAPRCCWI